jgi:hypothetical protein
MCVGSSLKIFVEPTYGCTGTISGGETSRAKDVENSPIAANPSRSPSLDSPGPKACGRGVVPPKKLLPALREGDNLHFSCTPVSEPATIPESNVHAVTLTTSRLGLQEDLHERNPSSGKRKQRMIPLDREAKEQHQLV